MDYETMGEELLGDDVLGDEYATVGRAAIMRPRRRIALPRRPQWRAQLAPGVGMPGEGMEPLPMTPSANNGILNLATQTMNFTARPQAPFRAERLIATVRRTGAAGVIVLGSNLFVGRQLQLVQVGEFDLENFSPTAFGVRLKLVASQPGVDISLTVRANPAITGGDTIAVSVLFLGHTIR